ncbi:MAG: bifunctional transaldolase/phosoglucose isomerase, partial [Acidobacteriota bacterium]|nr:bifunctional transaldolase/phosoglucose isomerase [Acidobacteriota bacterium]
MNHVKELEQYGQSVWLDYIRRNMFSSGELKRYIEEDGLRGMTSNPAIFEKAITGSDDYAQSVKEAQEKGTADPMTLFETLAGPDIQQAADELKPVYEKTKKLDGYVSLEVSPYRARDTEGTLGDARRLWTNVKRPNLMVKIPGTPEGVPAIEQAISEGLNINVTLLFSNEAYERVAQAYLAGLERHEGDLSGIASVASFFVSRIDAAVDGLLQKEIDNMASTEEQQLAKSLMGKVAIANAKLAYQKYKELFSGERWEKLKARGAMPQRLLWASTSTKNPEYRDVMYCEELIGPMTVNTMPPATLDAFRDHGRLRNSLDENVDAARATMANLEKAGISIKSVTDKLLVDGLKLFSDAFDKLLNALDSRCKAGVKPKTANQTYKLPPEAEKKVKESLEQWQTTGLVRRMWAGDPAVWTGKDEGKWLGWLTVTDDQISHLNPLNEVVDIVKQGGFTDALLLGMGGSSLCVEVLEKIFGNTPGFPKMHVLDSTDPAQIRAVEKEIDIAKTLFIVSSKSGSTLEPNIFKQYFFEKAAQVVGAGQAGKHFFAITDPGSKLDRAAKSDSFRCTFHGLPSIGGRYSALSNFGMVPAAAMGIDVEKLLDKTEEMVQSCTSCVTTDHNPGVILGTVLGTLANEGRDKITIVTSPAIADLGAWLEQLLAESTGKEGKGLIPVDREALGNPSVYGKDRVFCYVRYTPEPDAEQDRAVNALAQAGNPVVQIAMEDKYDLGQEFFRWEVATATAGSLLGINAFNQPDVEASKNATRSLTAEYEKNGSLPAETPVFEASGVKLFTDEENSQDLGKQKSLAGYLRAHLERLEPGDYFALLAYVEMNALHDKQLQSMRTAVRDHKKVATCLGFGPRFLHSTGQAYKGGPNTGVFLQITHDHAEDLPVPGQK